VESAEVHSSGPWPFVTLHRYRVGGRRFVWRARQHRKGLDPNARGLEAASAPVWQTPVYNWLTGALFAVGALLFMAGSAGTLARAGLGWPSGGLINLVFFLGSIPFTIAGYLQLFQAANAPLFVPGQPPRVRPITLLGWRPADPGWLSTFSQFVGTVAFNVNTFDAMPPPADWYAQDLAIWLPGLIGSVLFLLSGYLAFIEAGHAHWSWHPRDLAWRIVFVNLLGCVAFMVAGVLAYVPRAPAPHWLPALANTSLLAGAFCFLVGALLLMRESRSAGDRSGPR